MIKYLKIACLVIVLGFAILLILNKFAFYGILLIALSLIIYLLWNSFLKQKDKQIETLEKTNDQKDKKIAEKENLIKELEQRKINVTQLSSILELGLLEIDSAITRVVNREFDDGKIKFFGALRVEIKAKYGVDLNELRFVYDRENNRAMVYNLKPRFLSFAKRNCEWQIAETMELVKRNDILKLFGAGNYWRQKDRNDKLTLETCETVRKQVENEIENGLEEFNWIIEPLKNQIVTALRVFLFNPNTEICIENGSPSQEAISIAELPANETEK